MGNAAIEAAAMAKNLTVAGVDLLGSEIDAKPVWRLAS